MESLGEKCDNGNLAVNEEVDKDVMDNVDNKIEVLPTETNEIVKSEDSLADFEHEVFGKVAGVDTCTVPDPKSDAHQPPSPSKSPEVLLEEVQKEVTKLNISGDKSPKASPKESSVILNKTTDSLKSLMTYVDSESDSEDETSSEEDSSSDSSDVLFSESDDNDLDIDVVTINRKNAEQPQANNKTNVAKDILGIDGDLPPIPDLSQLTISETEEFIDIGTIESVIFEVVMVQSAPNKPALDLDSMLFIKDGTSTKPMGPIMDVIGNVMEPMYCVRLNSVEKIEKLGLVKGIQVYAAHKSEVLTKFVFLQQLLKMRGTDASWLNDNEAPMDIADYSDDEQERSAKKIKYQKRKSEQTNSEERYKRYEHAMNRKNTVITQMMPQRAPAVAQHGFPYSPVFMGNSSDIPAFDPAIPPPVINGGGEGVTGQSLFSRVRQMFHQRHHNRQNPDHNYINRRGPGPSSRPY